jgi:hypothetical protein
MDARYVHHEKTRQNGGFLCYIKEGDGKLRVTVIKLTHARNQANGERAAYGMSRSMLFASLNLYFLRLLFIPRTAPESVFDSFL